MSKRPSSGSVLMNPIHSQAPDTTSVHIRNEVLKAKPLPCLHGPLGGHRHIEVEQPEKYACEGSGPKYEAVGMLGMSNLVSDLKAVTKANDYCNKLGINVISAGAAIGFATECCERGLIR